MQNRGQSMNERGIVYIRGGPYRGNFRIRLPKESRPESGSGRGSLSSSYNRNAATSPMHDRNLPPRFLPRSVRCKICLSEEDAFRSNFRTRDVFVQINTFFENVWIVGAEMTFGMYEFVCIVTGHGRNKFVE